MSDLQRRDVMLMGLERSLVAELRARIAELEEALRYYAKQSCEGWCDEGGPVYGEDCYGCRARAVLEKANA